MTISVAKHGSIRTEPPYVVYVGRSKMDRFYGSDRCFNVLGNPYAMRAEADRETVCRQYKSWLWAKMKADDQDVLRALGRLMEIWSRYGKLTLVCHCAPRACHADAIKAALEWIASERSKHND